MYNKVIAYCFALLLGACASLQKPSGVVNVPENLKPPANESLAMIVAAKGVQIYECRAKQDQTGAYEWGFVAPEADLFDAGGKKIGRHYAGPHWESSDGSKVAGTLKERADAPQTDSIPWLLLASPSQSARRANPALTTAPNRYRNN